MEQNVLHEQEANQINTSSAEVQYFLLFLFAKSILYLHSLTAS